jgi:hypothetical protein
MVSRGVLVAISVLMLSLLSTGVVQAQFLAPAVTVDCSPDLLEIDSGPGGALTATGRCTLDNPSAFAEEIEISVNVQGLTAAYPETITLAAGDSETIDVVFAAAPRSAVANFDANITVQVASFNGVPCLLCGEEEDSFVIAIKQYAEWSLTVQTQFVTLSAESTTDILIEVENRGNSDDDYNINILNESGLQGAGLTFEVNGLSGEMLNQGGKETLTVTVSASNIIPTRDWEVRFSLESGYDSSYDIEEVFNLDTEEKPQTAQALQSLPPWVLPAAGAVVGGLAFIAVALFVWRTFIRSEGISTEDISSWSESDFDIDDDLLAEL